MAEVVPEFVTTFYYFLISLLFLKKSVPEFVPGIVPEFVTELCPKILTEVICACILVHFRTGCSSLLWHKKFGVLRPFREVLSTRTSTARASVAPADDFVFKLGDCCALGRGSGGA